MDLKVFLELQVEVLEVALEPLVFQVQRERGVSPSLEHQASQDQRGKEENQVLLDSKDSRVDLDFLVTQLDQALQDLWEIPVFLDWTANTVSKVLQVLPGPLVQAHSKEIGENLAFQVSQALPVGKENQDSLEVLDLQAAPVSKDCAVRLVSVGVLD